jgi:hypothetical protein
MVTNLEIAQLGELLPATIKEASKRLSLLMCYLMSPNVTALSESLVTDIAGIRLLARVTAFMGLRWQISATIL